MSEYEAYNKARAGKIDSYCAAADKALRADGKKDDQDFIPCVSDDRNSKKRAAQDQKVFGGFADE